MTTRACWKGLEKLLISSYIKCNGNVSKIQGCDGRFSQFTESQINGKIRDLKRQGALDKALEEIGIVC